MDQRVAQQRWRAAYPGLGTKPISIDRYIDQEYYKLECERVFRKAWLLAGRVEEIPSGGDFLVKEIPPCKASVLIVRGTDGTIRAFHNVCAHRCNRLEERQHGSDGGFICKFHGWTYDLEGRLTGVPDEDQFYDFRRADHALTAVAVDTWQGFLFVNLDPRPTQSLQGFLGTRGRELEGYPFSKILSCHSWTAEVNCNWKLAVDAFQEAYHVFFVHQHSISDAFKYQGNALAHPLALKLYDYHHMLSIGTDPKSVYGNALLQYDDAQTAGVRPAPSIELAALKYAAASQGTKAFSVEALPPGMNPAKSPNWNGDITVLFPNVFMFMRASYYQAYTFWPLAVDRTLFEGRVYYPRSENAGERFYEEYRKVVLRDVLLEDWSTMERVQAGMASGARTHATFQDNEMLLRHFHAVVDYFVGRGELPKVEATGGG
jgi:phenylpropionate dioxygenase-like ring-hydroxylating dioxygenase large terminal subunit